MKERKIDLLMKKEFQVGKLKLEVVDCLFIVCLFILGFIIRWKLMPIETSDFLFCLQDWMRKIREEGGIRSLAGAISDYTSPYMYIMSFLSYVSSNDLYALKMVSVGFDYVASIAMFMIIWQLTASVKKSILGMSVLLLLPTVILNGAYWGQCDIIYASFVLFAFYFFLKDKSAVCLFFLGIAFCIKLQAVFIIPFFIMMWMKKKTIMLRHFLWLPVMYVISAVPAWIIGRDFKSLMMIYWNQSGNYTFGTLEYPNIYTLLGESIPDMRHAQEVSGAGLFMTIILLGGIAYYLYKTKVRLTNQLMVTLALFTVALVVYSLPHMHERYGFLVDLLAVVYGILTVKKLPITCGFILVSVLCYVPYLIEVYIVPMPYLAIALLGLIVYVGYDLYQKIQENRLDTETI